LLRHRLPVKLGVTVLVTPVAYMDGEGVPVTGAVDLGVLVPAAELLGDTLQDGEVEGDLVLEGLAVMVREDQVVPVVYRGVELSVVESEDVGQ